MSNFLRLLYTVLFYLAQLLILPYLLFRSKKVPAYRYRWSERYGFCKKEIKHGGILLHSVSVGETLAAVPLVRALRRRYPSLPITVTTMTPTGSEQVISTFGKDVNHTYLPYDLPYAIKRFLNIVHPRLVIIMETELWPNMILETHKRHIPLIIANARLSERSAKGYKKLGKFMHYLLNKITLVAAQNEEDAMRFVELGLKYDQLAITGNLKLDISVTSEFIDRVAVLRNKWALLHRQVCIATSTHSGEELILLQAYQKLLKSFPNLLLILVPRHPERFKDVCKIVKKTGFSFILRSTGDIPSKSIKIVIGDTMGELMLLYGIADIAFVGGSLVKQGGHNPIEPAAHAVPILMGPYTFNFKDICSKLKQVGALITVNNKDSITKEIFNLLMNEDYRLHCGQLGFEVIQQNQGALLHLLKLLEPYLLLRNK